MKKFLVGGLAAAALAVPAVALAQAPPAPEVSAGGSVSNSNAGTPRNPTPVTFNFRAVNSAESYSTVDTITLTLPKGVRLDGSNLPTCTPTVANGGPTKCRRGSKLGDGVAYASLIADKTKPAPQCAQTRGQAEGCITFDLQFFTGGKRLLSVWLESRALQIQKPLTGQISKDARTLRIQIPRDLQFTFLYTALQQLSGQWRGPTRTIRGRKYSFVTTTGCPRGRVWSTLTTFTYSANPEPPLVRRKSAEVRQRCRP